MIILSRLGETKENKIVHAYFEERRRFSFLHIIEYLMLFFDFFTGYETFHN